MAKESKNTAKFSVPFRGGMETEKGYLKHKPATAKTYPDEKEFAFFSFTTEGIEVDDVKALESGRLALARAKVVKDEMGYLKGKYGIGGITQEDKAVLRGMLDITSDIDVIVAALQKGNRPVLKAMSADQIADLIDSLDEEEETNGD